MNWLALLLVALLQAVKPAPIAGLPADAGIYYHRDNAQWGKLEPASMADMKAKGLGEFLETEGLSGLDITVAYQGAKAKAQISAPQPTFYVRGVGSPKDAMIIQLTARKDSRTLKTSSVVATADNKGGFKKDAVQNVTVTVYADESFSVTPEARLKPGEYLLVFGYPNNGFDFGIARAQK